MRKRNDRQKDCEYNYEKSFTRDKWGTKDHHAELLKLLKQEHAQRKYESRFDAEYEDYGGVVNKALFEYLLSSPDTHFSFDNLKSYNPLHNDKKYCVFVFVIKNINFCGINEIHNKEGIEKYKGLTVDMKSGAMSETDKKNKSKLITIQNKLYPIKEAYVKLYI